MKHLKELDKILKNHIEGGQGAYKKLLDELLDYVNTKSIHFPEHDDKPTYEELVEALREVNRVFPIRPGDQDSLELTALWQVEQLLERIK